ncbi:hypothetical protein [Legionella fairfieldensis]|nr:hypothetical protein [Legionella fairfieldensis]
MDSLKQTNLSPFNLLGDITTFTYPEFINWFNSNQKIDNKTRYILESLYTSLLVDLRNSLSIQIKDETTGKTTNGFSKLKFILLAIAGTIFCGCEGFDGITAMLGVFSLPVIATFAAGILFSALSIMVFYAFDLVAISNYLGVALKKTPEIVDIYLEQVKEIESLRITYDKRYTTHDCRQLKEDIALIRELIRRYNDLDKVRNTLTELKENKSLKVAKYATAAIAGVIFFSGGFFAGQTVALAIAGLFFASAIVPTFWPVVLVSVLVGLAAFSVYWFVERPGIENLIGRFMGLDQEKIDKFCSDKKVEVQKDRLGTLLTNMEHFLDKTEKADQIYKSSEKKISEKVTRYQNAEGSNPYGFYPCLTNSGPNKLLINNPGQPELPVDNLIRI